VLGGADDGLGAAEEFLDGIGHALHRALHAGHGLIEMLHAIEALVGVIGAARGDFLDLFGVVRHRGNAGSHFLHGGGGGGDGPGLLGAGAAQAGGSLRQIGGERVQLLGIGLDAVDQGLQARDEAVEGDGNAAQLVVALNLQAHGEIAFPRGQGFDRLPQHIELGQDVADDGQGEAEADQDREDGQGQSDVLGVRGALLDRRLARIDRGFLVLDQIQQGLPDLAPDRGLAAVQAGLGFFDIGLFHQIADFHLQAFLALAQFRDLGEGLRLFVAGADLGACLAQQFVHIAAGFLEVLVGLGVGRVEDGVANGLAHLQAVGIQLGVVEQNALVLIDETGEFRLGAVQGQPGNQGGNQEQGDDGGQQDDQLGANLEFAQVQHGRPRLEWVISTAVNGAATTNLNSVAFNAGLRRHPAG